MDLFRPNDSFIWSCGHAPLQYADSTRIITVGVAGTVFALASILCNCLLLYVFSTSRRLRRQNYANPVLLAFFDVIVSFTYVLLLPAHVIAFHYEIHVLMNLWTNYVKYIYVLKHICESICNFLLVIASLERLFANSPEGHQKSVLVFMVSNKVIVFVLLIVASFILKGSLMLETDVEYIPHCELSERFIPVQSDRLDFLSSVRFWSRRCLTVILPLLILCYCNLRIVCELRHKHKENQQQSIKKRSMKGNLSTASIRRHYVDKKGVRIATRTLVLVVGCYILSNILSISIQFIEYTNIQLIQENYGTFLHWSDAALLMTVIGCALRLPIYCLSDARIRKAVGRAIFRFRLKALPVEVEQKQLDKWSIVVVSNSLRSNLTNVNTIDWLGGRSKRARDELAFLLQTRRNILVDMTFRLAVSPTTYDRETNDLWLTDIEEESHAERRNSKFRTIQAEV